MLLHADGFDHYGTGQGVGTSQTQLSADGYSQADGQCAIVANQGAIYPPNGVGMLQFNRYQGGLRRPITSTLRQSGQARICWTSGLSAVGWEPWGYSINDAGNNVIVLFAFRNDGRISVSKANDVAAGNILGSTAPAVVKVGAFQHFEFVYQPNTGGNNGKVEIYQEGVLILQINGLSIGTAPASHFWGWSAIVGNNPATLIKDWIIADTSGTVNNTIPLGPCRTSTRIATGNGTNNAWVPNGAATAWQCVAKAAPDSSSFMQGNNVNDAEDLTFPLSSVNVYGVKGVLVKSWAQKSSTGTGAFTMGIRSGATLLNGAAQIPGTSWAFFNSGFVESDPNTGVAWTKAAYDALALTFTRSA